jgi:hypothetical protein
MDISHLSYLKEKGIAWFNPSYGLNMFWTEYRKLVEKLGKPHDYVWSHRDLKRAKEIYATCIIAKVMEKQENTGKWWMLKPKNDPPDGVIGTLVETDGIKKMHIREVEVVEHISGEILDTIRNKLAGKQYEPNTILVCFVTQGGFYDFEKESKVISKEVTSLGHIFLVFTGTKASEIPQNVNDDELIRAIYRVSSVQIKPVFSFSSVDPIGDCKEWREGKEGNFLIFDGLGRGNNHRSITLDNPPKLF